MKEDFRKILFTIGFPLSPFYSEAMKTRSFLYRRGILKSHRFPVPVISVGNLTMGGSGKTPVVIYLAEMLLANGFKPAVVSRGYKGKTKADVTIVSNSKEILVGADEAGDEPVLIAKRVPGTVVATGKKRYLPCQNVISSFGCDVIILDDGFQHLPVKRDIDLVLFDTVFFAGNSRVFPGGDLREPVKALSRSTAFLMTGVNKYNLSRTGKCIDLLHSKFPSKPVFKTGSRYLGAELVSPGKTKGPNKSVPLEALPKKLIVFSGIANPERFLAALELDSISYLEFIPFPDHHNYSRRDIEFLNEKAEASGADGFLSTEKDLVRIADTGDFCQPAYSLPQYLTTESDLDDYILNRIRKTSDLLNDSTG